MISTVLIQQTDQIAHEDVSSLCNACSILSNQKAGL